MWVVAGILLGLVVLASLIGFHADPHAHAAGGVVVRVRGEEWSAVSVNGRVRAGSRVQVLRSGVRLEVWGEDAEPELGEPTWVLGAS